MLRFLTIIALCLCVTCGVRAGPASALPAPITALAYSPDGVLLAVAQHKTVYVFDAQGNVAEKIPAADRVTALAYDPGRRYLAMASGSAGSSGSVTVFGVQPLRQLWSSSGHKDTILNLAFSPDGSTIATAGYDRVIKLWDTATGTEKHVLRDHSDAVYGLAFSPDGKLLASAGADRAVKIWDASTGVRLYTLGESTDWVYALAWSPNGRRLAAAGVDRSIRVWQVDPMGGKIAQSVFGHEAPIVRLCYSFDGKALYSASEDRTVKAWNAETMEERQVYARQPETILALALRPDGKQLALGRFDGHVILLELASGKQIGEPLPLKPKPPELSSSRPNALQRGKKSRLILQGQHLEEVNAITFAGAGTKLVSADERGQQIEVEIDVPAQVPLGKHKLLASTARGARVELPIIVDAFPVISAEAHHDSPALGQSISLPTTVAGTISQAGNADYFRFQANAGQQIGVQVLASAIDSKLNPVLELTDDGDNVVAESTEGVLGYTCPKTGAYALGIRDLSFRGAANMHYRLHIGDLPVITSIFPLGIQRGNQAEIQLTGVNLGPKNSVHIEAPVDAPSGSTLPIRLETPSGPALGERHVVVGDFTEITDAAKIAPVPGTANGRISAPGLHEDWRFQAKKGQRVLVEVNAHRLRSPLDSFIEILDTSGKQVPRAVLRCTAKTYSVFRDHDATSGNIRIESWSELAMDDFIWVGSELIRILSLPRNPDDDCLFYSENGQRLGFLGTTPKHISMGMPMYKVGIHPPGTAFPPNGFPVIHLDYQNDDGGPGFGKDSRLEFDPPADGEYRVRISDTRGAGGNDFAYRLTIRPPRPDYAIHLSPASPVVWQGGAVPVTVNATRVDGFRGPIAIRFENLPAGLSAPDATIPAEENGTSFALFSDANLKPGSQGQPLKLVACALIQGKEVRRETAGGVVAIQAPGNLTASTKQAEVVLHPGQQAQLTVSIARRNGIKGRVPLEVRGLPHGVRVLDIGLNGILITEKESERTMAIYAEPWVRPMNQPFVVLAQEEGKGKEYAAKSVLLRIEK